MSPSGSESTRLLLTHPCGSSAEIQLHGGHVTRWVDADHRDRLYLSRRARFEPGQSIRGGIPVVFPQFASTGPLPKHGLVRTREWSVADQEASRAVLSIRDDADTRALWPHAFLAELVVSLGEALDVRLRITNTGSDPFSFTAALHTYFATAEVGDARVTGLMGTRYRDHLRNQIDSIDASPAIQVADEIDRVYRRAPPLIRLGGTGAPRDLELEAGAFGDWVIWNPGAKASGELSDMEPADFRRMLCVEAARIADPVTLDAGAVWTGTHVLRPVG